MGDNGSRYRFEELKEMVKSSLNDALKRYGRREEPVGISSSIPWKRGSGQPTD